MHIAICEDETVQQKELYNLLQAYQSFFPTPLAIEVFSNAEDLIEVCHYSGNRFDLIFLDIALPKLNGIEAAKIIRQMDAEVELVFLTSMLDYSLEGYHVKALRYLLKPIKAHQLDELLKTIKNSKPKASLTISNKFGQKKIALDQIYFIESRQRKLFFHTTTESSEMYGKLNDLEEKLKFKHFARCHQSYLIHLPYVTEIIKDQVKLENQLLLPISKAHRKTFKEAFFDYLTIGGEWLD